MTRQLLTFLGRVSSPVHRSYRVAKYQFADGTTIEGSYFGRVLLKYLCDRSDPPPPQTFVVIGTAGSMWDVLIDGLGLDDALEDESLSLYEAAQGNTVSQEQLDSVSPIVGSALGVNCRLVLIPYALTATEQIELIAILADLFDPRDEIVFDLTHGLRYLPMLGFLIAMYLEGTGTAKVHEMYYGALDLTVPGEPTPVVRLDGLLSIAQWLGALRGFDRDGNYSVFAELLGEDGVPGYALEQLSKAAFLESSGQLGHARACLKGFLDQVGKAPPSGMSALFLPALQSRLNWMFEDSEYARERRLAYHNLELGNYRIASLHGFESFVTRLEHEGWHLHYEQEPLPDTSRIGQDVSKREKARKAYENQMKRLKRGVRNYQAMQRRQTLNLTVESKVPRKKGVRKHSVRPTPEIECQLRQYESYTYLKDIRNVFAHGRSDGKLKAVMQALNSEATCYESLQTWLGTLLPESLPPTGALKPTIA